MCVCSSRGQPMTISSVGFNFKKNYVAALGLCCDTRQLMLQCSGFSGVVARGLQSAWLQGTWLQGTWLQGTWASGYMASGYMASGYMASGYMGFRVHGFRVHGFRVHGFRVHGFRVHGLQSTWFQGTWASEYVGSVVLAHGLSCPMACGIFVLWPGIKLIYPTLEGGFLTTAPPGKSFYRNLQTLNQLKNKMSAIFLV